MSLDPFFSGIAGRSEHALSVAHTNDEQSGLRQFRLEKWLKDEEQPTVGRGDAIVSESQGQQRMTELLGRFEFAWQSKSSFTVESLGTTSQAHSSRSYEYNPSRWNPSRGNVMEANESLDKEPNTGLVSKSPRVLSDPATPSGLRPLQKVRRIDGLKVDSPEPNPNKSEFFNEDKKHQGAHTLLFAFRSVFSDHPNFAEQLVSAFRSLPAGHQQGLLGYPLYRTAPCQLEHTTPNGAPSSSGSPQNAQSESTRSSGTLAQNFDQPGDRSSVNSRRDSGKASDEDDDQDGRRQKPTSRERAPDGGENSFRRRYACPFYLAYPEISAIDPRFSTCDQPKADENKFRGRSELKKHLESHHRRAEDQASPEDRFFISNDGRWARIARLFGSAPKTRPRQGREDHDLAFYINMWDIIGFPRHIPKPT